MRSAARITPQGHVVRLDAYPDLSSLQGAQPERYPYLLESVAHGTPQARYDILFAFPQDQLMLRGAALSWNGQSESGDFLSALDRHWQTAALGAAHHTELPFRGGWFLFLSYELAQVIEPSLAPLPLDQRLPVALATRIPAALIRDHMARCTYLVSDAADSAEHLQTMRSDLDRYADAHDDTLVDLRSAVQEEDPDWYRARIARVLEYIRAGDVFQVNLSRAWQAQLDGPLAPAELYRRLRRTNPAPFAGLIQFDGDHAVISSSPERLVSVRDGCISTRPIAGTYPRGRDANHDTQLARELLRNPKERAEHVMLIDLERNDLGRVCRPGSVRVSERMVLESYPYVHHIVSHVEGQLRPEVGPAQVIRAVFPGGTITGCPKVRTMQIIAELEQTARGAYTGSMGYLNHDGSMDLNILIRTVVQDGHTLRLRAGGGIVADSQIERELNETRAKARGMLAALGQSP